MHSSGLLSVVLAAGAAANGIQERAASDSAAFSTAITALVGSYLPSSVLSQIAPRITSAAAAAGTTGDAVNLLYQALEAPTPPTWLPAAIPTELGSNFAALTSQIASLRPTAGGTAGTALPTSTLIVATTTNSAGSTITTSFTSVLPTGTATGSGSGSGSGTGTAAGNGTSSSGTASGSGTSSGSSSATSSSKSGNAAAPTGAVHQAIGGVVALVGLAVAL